MDTPVADFVRRYAQSGALRLHMPGHKGQSFLGAEGLDITEIPGADSLYEAEGILRRSQANAGALFGCETYYSTEGSSHCIRAMVYLAMVHALRQGRRPRIAAARNVHRAFLTAAALLDVDVMWLCPRQAGSYLSCALSPAELAAALEGEDPRPTAVYVTSPDYLGALADIAGLAQVCRRFGCLLLVDNAHGAYLKFLRPSRHPIDLGADLCCDSAHKTLPVLTGGAYLHISAAAPEDLGRQAQAALGLFGSTSPSYLVLQSLDLANGYLEEHPRRLAEFLPQVHALTERLARRGYALYGQEPMKITLQPKSYGYTGTELAGLLQDKGVAWEFADPDYLVLMPTPETGKDGLARLEKALAEIPPKPPIAQTPPALGTRVRRCSLRQALLSPAVSIPAAESAGRILAQAAMGCPPAVPIVICGEVIDRDAVACFSYYGVRRCMVLDENGGC